MSKPIGERILIVSPFGIGDVIFSFSLIDQIRRRNPRATVHMLANERTRDLIELNPSIQKVYVFNRDRWRYLLSHHPFLFFKELGGLLWQIRSQRYETLIDLSLGRQYAFLLMCLGLRHRIGFDYKGRGFLLTEKTALHGYEGLSIHKRFLDLLGPSQGDALNRVPQMRFDDETIKHTQEWKKNSGCDTREGFIAIAPGGGRSWGSHAGYKQWSPSRFAALIKELSECYRMPILLFGDGGEVELCDRVQKESAIATSTVVKGQNLKVVARLLSESRLVVGNDGGLIHLANLLGRPVVAIFGPVDEVAYGPTSETGPCEILTAQVPCRPCYRQFRFPGCAYERRCLEEIEVDTVMTAANRLMKEHA